MRDKLLSNVGMVLMWVVSCAIGWKVLDRPGAWPVIATIFIVLLAGVVTNAVLSPGARVAKNG